jgi:hypothetical protein
MQPSDLHYEKAAPVPGWDKSLWPKHGYWLLSVRMERWSTYVTGLLAALAMLAIAGWAAAVSLATLGWIVIPDFLMPFRPMQNPWVLFVCGCILALVATVAIVAMLATMTAKAWQALRGWQPLAAPDPDYRVIDFRARRKR